MKLVKVVRHEHNMEERSMGGITRWKTCLILIAYMFTTYNTKVIS